MMRQFAARASHEFEKVRRRPLRVAQTGAQSRVQATGPLLRQAPEWITSKPDWRARHALENVRRWSKRRAQTGR